jgi:hypothetical protein
MGGRKARREGGGAETHRKHRQLVVEQLIPRRKVVHPHQRRLELRPSTHTRSGPRRKAVGETGGQRGPMKAVGAGRKGGVRTFDWVGQFSCAWATPTSAAASHRAAIAPPSVRPKPQLQRASWAGLRRPRIRRLPKESNERKCGAPPQSKVGLG